MIRKWLIRLVVGIAIFVAAAIGLNRYMTNKQGGEISVINQPSYPVMEISNENGDYNLMPAYESDIDFSLVTNQISAVDSNGQISIKLYCYDYDITAVQYALFKGAGSEDAIEEGTINQLDKNKEENTAEGTIKFEKNLEENQEYYLQMSVRLNKDTKTYFYTKVRNASELPLDDYIAFAKEFHEALFDKNNVEEYSTYLEPSSAAVDKSLDTVDIESTINSVFYGELSLEEQLKPQIKVKELNKTYAVLELSSVVSDAEQTDVIQYYNLTETIKMRYTTDRMYLLDYQRKMGAVYTGDKIDSTNNYLGIGIQNEDEVSFVSAAQGHKICFVDEGQLWYYDYDNSVSSKIYSVKTENLSDPHNHAGATNIKILSMTDDGKITYLIYGYMNRGSYEGKNGIAVMTYDPDQNYSEESTFLETTVPYEMMDRDLNTCAYLNDDQIFYCLLDGAFHKISLTDSRDEILANDIMDESLTVSSDGSVVALEKERTLSENQEIELINLQTDEVVQITCDSDECIHSVGFVLQEFIYAKAKKENVSTKSSGEVLFPANTLEVVDQAGEKVKEITVDGKYITKAAIDGTVIEMQTANLSKGKFKTNSQKEYVRYKKSAEAEEVSLTYVYSSSYYDQLYFAFPDGIYIKVAPELKETTLKAGQEISVLSLKKSENTINRYFVYASGELLEDYSVLSDAVESANEERGNVIDANENVVWQCIFSEYAQVANMTEVERASSDKGSLRACLRMIADLTGGDADELIAKSEDQSVEGLLYACTGKTVVNLSGSSLDATLYYVDTGVPVLTKLSGSRYVLVMSYNKEKVRYLDPVTGESTVVDREELTETLKKQGNIFYSYLK